MRNLQRTQGDNLPLVRREIRRITMKKRIAFIAALTLSLVLLTQGVMAGQYTELEFDGGEYAGYMENGKFDGFGMIVDYESGDMYLGNSYLGLFSGTGIYAYGENEDGAIHMSGFFIDGLLDDYGAIMLERDGKIYRQYGLWSKGDMVDENPQVTVNEYEWKEIIISDGVEYIGEVRYGTEIPHGYGAMYNTNSETMHVGEFKDGIPHGYGVQLNPDKGYFWSDWSEGKIIETFLYEGMTESGIAPAVWPAFK
jgi:hypothetical protein